MKKRKRSEGTLHFTKCISNGGTGFIFSAKLETGALKGKLRQLRVQYGPFSPNGNGEVSNASLKSESLLIKGSLPTKRGAMVTVVLTT